MHGWLLRWNRGLLVDGSNRKVAIQACQRDSIAKREGTIDPERRLLLAPLVDFYELHACMHQNDLLNAFHCLVVAQLLRFVVLLR